MRLLLNAGVRLWRQIPNASRTQPNLHFKQTFTHSIKKKSEEEEGEEYDADDEEDSVEASREEDECINPRDWLCYVHSAEEKYKRDAYDGEDSVE